MGSVKTEYFVEWQALPGDWFRSMCSIDSLHEAIMDAEKLLRPTRIVEVRTTTAERYMTLEFAKNERSK